LRKIYLKRALKISCHFKMVARHHNNLLYSLQAELLEDLNPRQVARHHYNLLYPLQVELLEEINHLQPRLINGLWSSHLDHKCHTYLSSLGLSQCRRGR
jgi:hypothetical protein